MFCVFKCVFKLSACCDTSKGHYPGEKNNNNDNKNNINLAPPGEGTPDPPLQGKHTRGRHTRPSWGGHTPPSLFRVETHSTHAH